MKFNIERVPGRYQRFELKLENDEFTFYDFGGYESRNESTIKLIIDAIKENESIFIGKKINITINTSDQTYDGCINFSHPSNKYLTIPDFTFDGWREIGIESFEDMVNMIKVESEKKYEINKVFWSGSVGSNIPVRMKYKNLSALYSDILICNEIDFIRDNPKKLIGINFTTLPEHCKYKYLLDLEGVGWSARLKFLCFTNRVLILNDRPYKEYWMDGLIDGENCIIVNRDLSNLVERITEIEKNPDMYKKLRDNLKDFAKKTLTLENAKMQIIDVLRMNIVNE